MRAHHGLLEEHKRFLIRGDIQMRLAFSATVIVLTVCGSILARASLPPQTTNIAEIIRFAEGGKTSEERRKRKNQFGRKAYQKIRTYLNAMDPQNVWERIPEPTTPSPEVNPDFAQQMLNPTCEQMLSNSKFGQITSKSPKDRVYEKLRIPENRTPFATKKGAPSADLSRIELTDNELRSIASELKSHKVEHLILEYNFSLTYVGIIKALKAVGDKLINLDLSLTAADDAVIDAILKYNPNIQHLDLPKISEVALIKLTKLKKIRALNIRHKRRSLEFIKTFIANRPPSLESLYVAVDHGELGEKRINKILHGISAIAKDTSNG